MACFTLNNFDKHKDFINKLFVIFKNYFSRILFDILFYINNKGELT